MLNVSECRAIESSAQFETRELIERVVILGVRHRPSKIIGTLFVLYCCQISIAYTVLYSNSYETVL